MTLGADGKPVSRFDIEQNLGNQTRLLQDGGQLRRLSSLNMQLQN